MFVEKHSGSHTEAIKNPDLIFKLIFLMIVTIIEEKGIC